MKRIIPFLFCLTAILHLPACKSKDTPKSIAQKWCDLNGKYHRAAEGYEKESAMEARKSFEKKMEAKYRKDETFSRELRKEVEKCEDASEGR